MPQVMEFGKNMMPTAVALFPPVVSLFRTTFSIPVPSAFTRQTPADASASPVRKYRALGELVRLHRVTGADGFGSQGCGVTLEGVESCHVAPSSVERRIAHVAFTAAVAVTYSAIYR